jgi:hypothetical protein
MAEANQTNPSVQFEHRDVSLRAMLWIGAAIIVTAIVLHLVLYRLYDGLRAGAAESGRITKSSEVPQQTTSAQPQLQVDPAADINQLRAEENKKLNAYGWIDKDKGVVRIPIDRAINIMAARGITAAGTVNSTNAAPVPAPRIAPKDK